MAEIRLNKIIKQYNIGLQNLVDFLNSLGAGIEANPNAKVSDSFLPAPVAPVMAVTCSSSCSRCIAASGTEASWMAVAKQPGLATQSQPSIPLS